MHRLNPQQAAAVRNISSPLLVLAGAGSGKTSVITQKIAHLVKECGFQPEHIAAVTFTNKAAREMQERVAKSIGREEAKDLKISTFHTLGLNIIRAELKALDMRHNFSIFDAQDAMALLAELTASELKGDKQALYGLQTTISDWKNALLTPEQAQASVSNQNERYAAVIYKRYQEYLQSCNALDFDDLIMRPTQLLMEDREIRNRWQNKIRYMLVDEYQDTNDAQYQLVKAIVGPEARFTVVGDDDQSIYAWRGANPENLKILKEDFPSLELVKLEQNYRCSGRVLKAANALIANNPHIFVKRLWSDLGFGDPIRVVETPDEEQEARRVVSDIISRKSMGGVTYDQFAILYRGNFQARQFEKILIEYKVPYKVSGGTSFFARTEIRDIMAYFRLLVNPDDDAAFIRIANVPKREVGATTLKKLGDFARLKHCSLFDAIKSADLAEHLSSRGVKALRDFRAFIEHFARECYGSEPFDNVDRFIREIGYDSYLLDTSSSPEAAEYRWQNVKELLRWVEMGLKETETDDALSDVITKLVLRDRESEDEDNKQEVQLLTLHAAKGLEYEHVYMVGFEEELLPHKSSIEEDNIEEERRLCYVGITRAKKTLTLTLASQRKRFGEMVTCRPSRFLDEIPSDDLDWPKKNAPISEEEQRDRGRSHLAGLRAMLDS